MHSRFLVASQIGCKISVRLHLPVHQRPAMYHAQRQSDIIIGYYDKKHHNNMYSESSNMEESGSATAGVDEQTR